MLIHDLHTLLKDAHQRLGDLDKNLAYSYNAVSMAKLTVLVQQAR